LASQLRYERPNGVILVTGPTGSGKTTFLYACLSKEDKCQLFNLKKDPYETKNLYDSGRHEDVIARLTQKNRAWLKKVKDDVEVI
jgi:general secretion pathway protein E